MGETELETLQRERNLYKGKYRALLKLISKTRDKLVQVTDHIEDEGDRAYFGSTNHADDLKELYHEMMSWIWDSVDETNRMKSDPYADIRKQRARAKKAEAEVARLKVAVDAIIDRYGTGALRVAGKGHDTVPITIVLQTIKELGSELQAEFKKEAA